MVTAAKGGFHEREILFIPAWFFEFSRQWSLSALLLPVTKRMPEFPLNSPASERKLRKPWQNSTNFDLEKSSVCFFSVGLSAAKIEKRPGVNPVSFWLVPSPRYFAKLTIEADCQTR